MENKTKKRIYILAYYCEKVNIILFAWLTIEALFSIYTEKINLWAVYIFIISIFINAKLSLFKKHTRDENLKCKKEVFNENLDNRIEHDN